MRHIRILTAFSIIQAVMLDCVAWDDMPDLLMNQTTTFGEKAEKSPVQ